MSQWRGGFRVFYSECEEREGDGGVLKISKGGGLNLGIYYLWWYVFALLW